MMKTRKHIRTILLGLIVALNSCYVQKIIDSSHDVRPQWVFGITPGYLTGFGTGTSVEDAQKKAIIDIRTKITEAVYNEIQSRREFIVRETGIGKTYSVISNFLKETITTTGGGVLIRGVSLNKAGDYYYDTFRDKSTGQILVRYAVKYPFSSFELGSLLDEWEVRQKRLIDMKHEVEARTDSYKNVETIIADISLLERIKSDLLDEHEISADLLIIKLKSLLGAISIIKTGDGLDFIRFRLELNGRPINTDIVPVLRSGLILVEGIIREADGWKAVYRESNYSTSFGRDPVVSVMFGFGSFRITGDIALNCTNSVQLLTPMHLHGIDYSFWGTNVNSYDLLLRLQVKGLGGITIEKIMVKPVRSYNKKAESMPLLSFEFPSGIAVYNGESMQRVRLARPLKKSDSSVAKGQKHTVSGTLFYRENITGIRKSIDFRNIGLTSDW